MERLIAAQGVQTEQFRPGKLRTEILAGTGGAVSAIDCHLIARIARLAGAPMDKGAGIDLMHKIGDRVRAGEPLYRIHADSDTGLRFAADLAAEDAGYRLLS